MPKHLKPEEKRFWEGYLALNPEASSCPVSASMAGDERNSDALLQLYLDGKKSAGSGLLKDYQAAGDPIPETGQFWIILDSGGQPRCLVKTVKVEIHAFDSVPAYVAEAEAEGDLSLAFWRSSHAEFFGPYLKQLGIQNLAQEKIVTEFFQVVHRG